MDLKKIVVDTALEFGFARAVVASLTPMEAERRFYENWLAQGFAGNMGYLGRDPALRNSPGLLCPDAYCAIVLFSSYYSEPPPDPGPQFGRVARYAVGLDYHDVIPARLAALKAALETKIGRPLLGKFFTDDVQLYEQAFANRSGLGFTGKNTMIIGPKMMGSYHFIAEFFTDLPLEADEPYKGTCGNCFRCAEICPTDAIIDSGVIDARLCISYLTIEYKGSIPEQLRTKMGSWIFGCDECQEICPYNKRPPQAIWEEFDAAKGAGHWLNLLDLLQIHSPDEYKKRFGHTPLSRPKRRGLLRNALVALGNRRPENAVGPIVSFAENEGEPLLREHAAWALSRFSHAGRNGLERVWSIEQDQTIKKYVGELLEQSS